MRVLLVEDDDAVAKALMSALIRYGIVARRIARGRDALGSLTDVDVVLLDLGLPDMDGVGVCRSIRAASDVAVIIVTAHSEVDERILALHSGADDYLVKPYDIGELLARMRAVLRRRLPNIATVGDVASIRAGDVQVDLAAQKVTVAGTPVALSRKEYEVLALIAAERGAVCSRQHMIAQIWGRAWKGANGTLDVHIATLRAKLKRPDLIETIRGFGYRLAID